MGMTIEYRLPMWICPACRAPLSIENRTWRCSQNHSFDVAKEGYVNLLLPQHKRSKEPGDSKDMIHARRTFLSHDYYRPLAEHISQNICNYCDGDKLKIFDAGCGEGYYLAQVARVLAEQGRQGHYLGCDIAKVAVAKAAKAMPQGQFCVASSFAIPLADNSLNAVIQVFAPSAAQEVLRVLEPGGIWIAVNPAAHHLKQLKSFVYEQVQNHSASVAQPEGFSVLERKELQFEFQLQSPDLRQALLKMTPFYWSASEEAKAQFMDFEGPCQAHFDIQVLQKPLLETET